MSKIRFFPLSLLFFTKIILATEINISLIEGVYKFKGGKPPGSEIEIENILEIIKFDKSSIYFRLRTDSSTTGCICALSGIASEKENSFKYQEAKNTGCQLSIVPKTEKIILIPENKQCCNHCSSPVLFDFPVKKKRTIRYIDKIKASSQFELAVKNFQSL